MVYQSTSGWEEDATLNPTCAAKRGPSVGSQMTMPSNVRGGRVFEEASETLGSWSVVHCLFQLRVGGGGRGV